MRKFLIVATILAGPPVAAQTSAPAPIIPTKELSIREQIKADRAKDEANEKKDIQPRPWDRDANGKRPWDRIEVPAK